ncbi:MAG TPA: uroporphyrinogen-III synthase [Thiobacillaceae bacterium]|nr:uroporphyrinogen-III synthase [Thiobacillaceae bacterium]
MNPAPLLGKTIVITRPKEQAGRLAGLIREAGGEALIFPAVEIRDLADASAVNALIDRLDDFNLAIFISPTAVVRGMALISSRRNLPPELQIAAVGQGSARELKQRGVANVLAPTTRFDSEALLDLPGMQQMSGKRVVIFRGAGGRELLATTLRQRGATVDYAECYRRTRPATRPAELLERGARDEIHALVATSAESVKNLCEMVGEQGASWLRNTPVFVPHAAIEQAGRKLGLTRLIVAQGDDEGLLQAIIAHLTRPK